MEAMTLLVMKFAYISVRKYAVKQPVLFNDREIVSYLLQLVQALKYELYDHSTLFQFLLRCSHHGAEITLPPDLLAADARGVPLLCPRALIGGRAAMQCPPRGVLRQASAAAGDGGGLLTEEWRSTKAARPWPSARRLIDSNPEALAPRHAGASPPAMPLFGDELRFQALADCHSEYSFRNFDHFWWNVFCGAREHWCLL
jgi:hypothetical protein